MKVSLRAALVLSLGLSIMSAACGGDDNPPPAGTGGTTGSTGGTTGSTGGTTGGSGGTTGGSGGTTGTAAVTWTADVKPIFMVKCAPCHVDRKTFHQLGAVYDGAKNAPTNKAACGDAATTGACTILRIKNGSMPAISPKCTGTPAMDVGNDKCLTKAEQDKVQAWVDGGLKE